ncbi:MAG: hypothetical protein JHC20_04835 [Pyrobaculum sp.]|nr:hypothetical protein [Pyrobaculum sp.]
MRIGEETSTRSAGGRRLLRSLDDRCLVEARAVGGGLWLKTQAGPYAVEPNPNFLLAVAYKLAEVCGGKEVYLAIRRELAKVSAGGLDRWLY